MPTIAETICRQYEDGKCPDCGDNIPDTMVDGGECANCGHVFYAPESDSERIESLKNLLSSRFGRDDQAMSEALDDLVHDLASQIGSSINNGGLDSQIEFISEQCGDFAVKTVADHIEGEG